MDYGKIAIGARITNVDPVFFRDWTRLVTSGLRPGDVVLLPVANAPHSAACNILADQFLNSDCDTLLFVDDDMTFAQDALERLRTTEGEYDIVSGMYVCRREPFNPILLVQHGDKYLSRTPTVEGVLEVDVVGFGFTLIRRAVIQELLSQGNEEGVFVWRNKYGEDGDFCLRAKQCGYTCAVNCGVVLGHRVTFTLSWDIERHAVGMRYETTDIHQQTKKGLA